MSTERQRPIERLAHALQDCLDEAARKGAQEAMDRIGPRLDRQDETLRLIETRLDRQDEALRRIEPRLDRQDDTLRLMWKQMKGNGSLPIDRE